MGTCGSRAKHAAPADIQVIVENPLSDIPAEVMLTPDLQAMVLEALGADLHGLRLAAICRSWATAVAKVREWQILRHTHSHAGTLRLGPHTRLDGPVGVAALPVARCVLLTATLTDCRYSRSPGRTAHAS